MTRVWSPDVALPEFEATTIPLAAEDDGELVATVVRKRTSHPTRRAVLYVHGFIDYFFQTHVAEAFCAAGWDFYAIDLRRYGRSLRPGNRPNYITDLAQYHAELDEAMRIIGYEDGHDQFALFGHSTGGLIASLYADHGQYCSRISALVLNSPFFEFNLGSWQRRKLPFGVALGRVLPFLSDPNSVPSTYFESLLRAHHGEWEYDLRWRPFNGFPAYFGWVRAIRKGHQQVARGLRVRCPVLILHSAKSARGKTWRDEFLEADTVLDVEHIKKFGARLGNHVSMRAIHGAIHDVFLSREAVREQAMNVTLSWLAAAIPENAPVQAVPAA